MAPKPTISYNWIDDGDGELTPLESSDEESDPEPELPALLPSPLVAPTTKVKEVPNNSKATRLSTQQATKQSRDRVAAKSSPYLKSPRTTTYSLSSLHEMMTSGTIDLDPEYQRAVVWTTTKQEGLIDSLYHNFYVPPIIFATTTREEDGAVIRTCIDGKQRLTSMRLFMDGKLLTNNICDLSVDDVVVIQLSHKDSLKGNRSWFISPKGSKRRLISPQWQSKFKQTQIACVEYDDITEEQQREIFQRVQMGVTLTPAERLQSANGPIADLIREVRVRVSSTEGFEGYLDWGKARGKDFKILAEIAYLITHAKTARSDPTIQRLDAFLDNKPHPVPAAKRREELLDKLRPILPNVMDIFCRILQHPELGEPLRKNICPLEVVMSAYLIYVYRKTLSDTKLSHAIVHLKRERQRSFEDTKIDSVKRKHLFAFIHKNIPKLISKLNDDGCRDVPAIQVPYQRVESKFRDRLKDSKVVTGAKTATKRKHNELGDEKDAADSDDEPLIKRKVKPKRSSSDLEEKTIDTGRPPKPQAPTSRPLLNISRSSAPVSKAKTAVKRTSAKQQSTSQTSDVKNSAPAPPMVASKSESFQVASPSAKPPSPMRMVSGRQRVISRLGAQLLEPVALGRRAEAARISTALPQPPTTAPMIPARQTPTPNSQKNSNSDGNSPIVQQSTLPSVASSTSSGSASGSVFPPSRMNGSGSSGSLARTRAAPDRLAPIRNAKMAASNGTATVEGFPQVSHPGSADAPETSSINVDDADIRWQMAFADLLPAQSRITDESTAMVSSRALAPSTDVRMHDAPRSRSHHNSAFPSPTPSPRAPSIQSSGYRDYIS